MDRQQVVVGILVVVLCGTLGMRDRWFLQNTRKGQRLVEWFGPERAPWVLRALLLGGMIFGGLLAADVIRPIRW